MGVTKSFTSLAPAAFQAELSVNNNGIPPNVVKKQKLFSLKSSNLTLNINIFEFPIEFHSQTLK